MHTTERKDGSWFAHRDDGTIMGNIRREGEQYRAYAVRAEDDIDDLGLHNSRVEALHAIGEED
ncbi:hypothetical protein DEJ21_14355 [Curtobacterium sp. MCSS17_006]|uniref:hypothetical protein n=1 Tax=Curtobacterium sp. MCSS17_006 TaxID=2175642 RepID=UPI000DA9B63A|nr:hypothetical protein [Curtobacterium sp. MCSS17_006]PZE34028.1 hypothetical protein DEJ21_14355 [Curtobacterium sp. MCSS17_006]